MSAATGPASPNGRRLGYDTGAIGGRVVPYSHVGDYVVHTSTQYGTSAQEGLHHKSQPDVKTSKQTDTHFIVVFS